MVVVFLLGMLAASINERKAEVASIYNNKKIELTQTNAKNGDWGLNYPREYETWKMTEKGDFKSKYNGNDEHDVLADRPNMVILWAGYAFSQDYTKPRGHMHAIEDMRRTLRTGAPMDGKGEMQPGTCWTCKSPDVPRYMAEHGIAEFYAKKWSELGNEIVNPIGCADCHDAKTMNLRVSRPALIEAFKRQGKDINNATQQEMRSLVCAQCHEEYYFKKGTNYLTFPFDKGQTVEAIEQYYDEQGFTDYVHKLSKAPILKAQHPGWSMFLQGPHGQHGVACADCPMPYKAEGGIKYSDHQIMSPLAKISSTCQTCHRESEENLRNWANENLRKGEEVRTVAEEALAKDHIMAKACWDAGATEEEMQPILKLIRQSQWALGLRRRLSRRRVPRSRRIPAHHEPQHREGLSGPGAPPEGHDCPQRQLHHARRLHQGKGPGLHRPEHGREEGRQGQVPPDGRPAVGRRSQEGRPPLGRPTLVPHA